MLQTLIHLIWQPNKILKGEVDKRNIHKLTNVPISLNNLKTKVDDLDLGKQKTFISCTFSK